jgi:hypothetical protein
MLIIWDGVSCAITTIEAKTLVPPFKLILQQFYTTIFRTIIELMVLINGVITHCSRI